MTSPIRTRAKGQLRDQLLDAAVDHASRHPWQRVRLADVAASVGVSRQTLYNEFGSKDAMAQAMVQREVQVFLAEMRARMDAHDQVEPAIRASASWVLEHAQSHPVVQRVLRESEQGHDNGLLALLTTRSDAILTPASAFLLTYLESRWPYRAGPPATPVVDLLVRTIVSHIVLPGGAPDQVGADIATIVEGALPR